LRSQVFESGNPLHEPKGPLNPKRYAFMCTSSFEENSTDEFENRYGTTSFTKTYSSYAYRFFKSTESSYDADNFDVTLNKNGSKYEAIEATP